MSTATVWARATSTAREPVESLVRAFLGDHVVAVEDAGLGGTGIVRVTLEGADRAAIDRLGADCKDGLDTWPVEPRCVFWQRSSRKRAVAMVGGVEGQELVLSAHPPIRGMLRIEVLGALAEETFHMLDDRPLWTEEPRPCSCARGCVLCRRLRALPSPGHGFAGCGGP